MKSAPAIVSIEPLAAILQGARHGFIRTDELQKAGSATAFCVNVTNTGSVDADDVVLGFLTPPGAGTQGIPLKSLFGFERVHVKAGQTVTVWLYPEFSALTHVREDGVRIALPGQYKVTST